MVTFNCKCLKTCGRLIVVKTGRSVSNPNLEESECRALLFVGLIGGLGIVIEDLE